MSREAVAGRESPEVGKSGGPAISPRAQPSDNYFGVPPVKKAPWEWYIPIYFWAGGIAGGAWLAAAAEDLAGDGERGVIRAGRWLSVAGAGVGTVLLILDLGRPERFLNMLRVLRTRSAMSLGSWGLVAFSGVAGAAAALQAAEDGWFGEQPWLARQSRAGAGTVLHALGLPLALFVGGYTGTLLSSTATPSWARRRGILTPLFLASSASTGLAAVSAATSLAGTASPHAKRRLDRAEALALGAEMALVKLEQQAGAALPSEQREEPAVAKAGQWLSVAAGMAVPLAMSLKRGLSAPKPRHRTRTSTLISAGLVLAGGLALRYLTTSKGYRSAATPGDTWMEASPAGGRW